MLWWFKGNSSAYWNAGGNISSPPPNIVAVRGVRTTPIIRNGRPVAVGPIRRIAVGGPRAQGHQGVLKGRFSFNV